ncbi:putative inactive tyrosine-protein kinase Wsck [Anastrepha obliqua]|uniref:putative inactive tyrosine-protein kinase Wsck n=1 Tax=Anastrepha obliqua TaxID=95512 RepID=UPI00240A147C|nr:putative inactive tyrosine-protein kinase Wsck [Anastrepha obliqua]
MEHLISHNPAIEAAAATSKMSVTPLEEHRKTLRPQCRKKAYNSGHRPSNAWSHTWRSSSGSNSSTNASSLTHLFTFRSGHILRLATLFFGTLLTLVSAQTTDQLQIVPIAGDSTFFYVGCYTARSDLFKESIYAKTPQSCVEMCEHQKLSYAILSAERCFCTNNVISKDRQDDNLCNTRCLADKSQYCGGVGVHSYYSTVWAAETAPRNLRVANVTENTITIAWDMHVSPSKVFVAGVEATAINPVKEITNFLIRTHVLHSYSTLPFFPQPEFIVQSMETSFEITDLHPATEYNITVEAMCAQDVCGNGSLHASTEVGIPNPLPPQPRIVRTTDSTMTIEIAPLRNDNGPLTKVLVIVERVDESLSQPFDTELLGSWQKAQEDGLPYYIAAQLDYNAPEDNRTSLFIVGDGKRYGPYVNMPLNATGADIHLSLGVVSTLNGVTKTLYTRGSHEQHSITLDNFTYATFDSGRASIIALTVTCIVFAICLVLSVFTYFYLRYKTCQARNVMNRNAHEMTMQQPIIERENNGFVVEDELPPAENFRQQLDVLISTLDASKRLPRNALRMNVNDIFAEGRYGEVITGKFISTALPEASADCQLHVLALDELQGKEQAHLLRDFRNLSKLQRHEHLLDFYGISASSDWFYLVFEHQNVSLKRRLIESRRVPSSAPMQRITALSEELVLQWIYEIASALEYLTSCKVVHKQLCSHNIFVTADAKLKVSLFGPIPYVQNQKKVDITRWLAPEALRYQHFSVKSDVWSFACVAWECCTLGGTLYSNINNTQQLLDAIKSGSRPAQPTFVFQDLYQLLLNCWQLEPSERINFDEIAYNVRQLMTSPRHALCFDRATEMPGNNVLDTLPYYMPMLEMLN